MPETVLTTEFANGIYDFALPLPRVVALQNERGCGIFELYGRVIAGRYVLDSGIVVGLPEKGMAFIEDLYAAVRIGLIGGGRGIVDGVEVKVDAVTAARLVKDYLEPAPLMEAWTLAAAVLVTKVVGPPPKKAEPAKEPAAERPRASTKRKPEQTA